LLTMSWRAQARENVEMEFWRQRHAQEVSAHERALDTVPKRAQPVSPEVAAATTQYRSTCAEQEALRAQLTAVQWGRERFYHRNDPRPVDVTKEVPQRH
jgi:hypothetical protein